MAWTSFAILATFLSKTGCFSGGSTTAIRGTLGNDSGQKDYWDLAEFSGISEHDWRWGRQENWQSFAHCTTGLPREVPCVYLQYTKNHYSSLAWLSSATRSSLILARCNDITRLHLQISIFDQKSSRVCQH